MTTTHDLRNKFWRFVPQAEPDGRVSIIRVDDPSIVHHGDFLIIGNRNWQARYLVLGWGFPTGALRCEYAPRTLAEIALSSSPDNTLQESRA